MQVCPITDRCLRPGRRGFSLIELLVVMGIIILLAGMIAPSLGMARQRARSVSCLGNLKQLGLATQMYWDDNNSKLVALNGVFPVWGDPDASNAWTYALLAYHHSPALYRDPGRANWMTELPIDYYLNILPSYKSTTNGVPGLYPVDSRSMNQPSAYILISEDLYLSPPQEIDPTNEVQDKTGFSGHDPVFPPYHLGQVNMLFGDGHVDHFGKFDVSQMTYWYHTLANWQDTVP